MNLDRGVFLVFEGVDYSGKTTQARRLTEYLTARGFTVCLLREPGGTEFGEEVRRILKTVDMHPITEVLAFFAARNEILRTVIIPALNNGEIVILDRFYPSSYVYQVGVKDVPEELYHHLISDIVPDQYFPERVFFLDIDYTVAMDRAMKDGRASDRLDLVKRMDILAASWQYRTMAQWDAAQWVTIDGDRSEDEVFDDIRREVEELLQIDPLDKSI